MTVWGLKGEWAIGFAQNFLARDWMIWSKEGIPGSEPVIWVSGLSLERNFLSTSVVGTLQSYEGVTTATTEQKKKPAFFLLGEIGVIWSFPF